MAKSFDALVKRTTTKKTRQRAARRALELLCGEPGRQSQCRKDNHQVRTPKRRTVS